VIATTAHAKINLVLRIGAVRPNGLHGIDGVFQSVDLGDTLRLEHADEDALSSESGGEVVDGRRNLAWRAVAAVRDAAGSTQALSLQLAKRIPIAAGLGGGSADAAAGLAAAGALLGVDGETQARLAVELGSDVPFCLVGGTARVSGTGERVDRLAPAGGYAAAIVVPPVEVSTAAVFAAWDRLDGSEAPEVGARDVPPSLRAHAPLGNELYPAAVEVAPLIDEWRAELASRWGRPVVLSGSGPSLFSFFVDADEASDALAVAPLGARAAEAVSPVRRGWELVGDPGVEV
jgi:4-diphosphocytidyl-2-C-methyl-D-erythritol kinase